MSITRRGVLAIPALAALPAAMPVRAAAAPPVKIGYIEPLTGNAASAGQSIKQGVELALDIINSAHPDLAPLPLAATAGLPRLGGAMVEVTWADNQGSPAVGQSDALRLITQDRVVALCGAYQSNVTLTASAVAERYGIPFLTGESVAANLTERGYQWFFRTTPFGPDFGKLYLDFLAYLAKHRDGYEKDRDRAREHRLRDFRLGLDHRRGEGARADDRADDLVQRQRRPTSRRRCWRSRTETPTSSSSSATRPIPSST